MFTLTAVKKIGSVAVIGAGLSGLSCAQALQASGLKVRVFERSSAVGGRCATQLWQGHLVDTGVQHFTAQSGDFKKELLTRLRQFRPLVSPIVDENNKVIPTTLGPRFYVLQGNHYFAHVLSQGLDIRLNTEVGPLAFKSPGVKCLDENYDAVVSSVPGPQSVRLFGLKHPVTEYEPALIALLEYGGTDLGQVREAYAHVLADANGPLRASYCENNKVGRIVGNKSVFVVEATARYSREFAEAPSEIYLPDLIKKHEAVWDIPSKRMTAAYGSCWKFGRPRPGGPRSPDLPPGGFTCGDSYAESTVESVWANGQKTAQDVVRYLTKLSS
jgi:predicted NAD/FAD-dependent oxidoreductase